MIHVNIVQVCVVLMPFTDHLTGSPRGRRTLFSQIYEKTKCSLTMQPHESHIITIETKPGKFAIDSLRMAKIELENIFLDYLNHDGAIGRLFFDLAVSCQHLHPQRGRTCVHQRNPWQPDEMGYMSVVELPFIRMDGNEVSHCHHIRTKRVLSRCVGCDITVVDKGRGRVQTRWVACNPYILVWGTKPGDVDEAVRILNDVNREHVSHCTCRLPR